MPASLASNHGRPLRATGRRSGPPRAACRGGRRRSSRLSAASSAVRMLLGHVRRQIDLGRRRHPASSFRLRRKSPSIESSSYQASGSCGVSNSTAMRPDRRLGGAIFLAEPAEPFGGQFVPLRWAGQVLAAAELPGHDQRPLVGLRAELLHPVGQMLLHVAASVRSSRAATVSVCQRTASVGMNCVRIVRSPATCTSVQPCGPGSSGERPCGLPA